MRRTRSAASALALLTLLCAGLVGVLRAEDPAPIDTTAADRLAHIQKAIAAFQEEGKWEEAIEEIDRAMEIIDGTLAPVTHANMLNSKGRMLIILKYPEGAVAAFQQARSHLKKALNKHVKHKSSPLNIVGGDGALIMIVTALTTESIQDKFKPRPWKERVKMHKELIKDELDAMYRGLAEAQEAQGSRKAAAKTLEEAAKVFSDKSTQAYFLKSAGVMRMRTGETEAAVKLLQDAVDKDHDTPKGWSNLGLALQKLQKFDSAKLALEEAAEQEPKNSNVLAHLGALYAQIGDYLSAQEKLQEAVTLEPGHKDASENLKKIEELLDDPEVARNLAGDPRMRSRMARVGPLKPGQAA